MIKAFEKCNQLFFYPIYENKEFINRLISIGFEMLKQSESVSFIEISLLNKFIGSLTKNYQISTYLLEGGFIDYLQQTFK